ncbi:hypothetical protein N9L68_00005 [bacterium]|nr:hypothetical protein [bacterium]
MLLLGMKQELGREGEQTRREVKKQKNHALPESFLDESLGVR